jgi:hypothetical protein
MFRSFVADRSRNGCHADGEQLFVRPAAAVEMDAAPTYAEGRTIRLDSHPNLRSHEATQSACVRGQSHLLQSILMLLAFRPPSVVLVEEGRWGGLFGTMVRLIIKVSLRHLVPLFHTSPGRVRRASSSARPRHLQSLLQSTTRYSMGKSAVWDPAMLENQPAAAGAPILIEPRVLRFVGSTPFSSDLTANYLFVPVRNRKRMVANLPVKHGADPYGYTNRARIAILWAGFNCDNPQIASSWRGRALKILVCIPKLDAMCLGPG